MRAFLTILDRRESSWSGQPAVLEMVDPSDNYIGHQDTPHRFLILEDIYLSQWQRSLMFESSQDRQSYLSKAKSSVS
jgi:hypothetical protein